MRTSAVLGFFAPNFNHTRRADDGGQRHLQLRKGGGKTAEMKANVIRHGPRFLCRVRDQASCRTTSSQTLPCQSLPPILTGCGLVWWVMNIAFTRVYADPSICSSINLSICRGFACTLHIHIHIHYMYPLPALPLAIYIVASQRQAQFD